MSACWRAPGQVKNLPGRPERDPPDWRWLAACFERGPVTGCLAAAPGFGVIGEHTRYRGDLTAGRTGDKQRAGKPGESAVKISPVITGLHAMTGPDIRDHLIAGERGPRALAELARGKARPETGRLAGALQGAGFFTGGHAGLLKPMPDRIDRIDTDITGLSRGVIGDLLAPCEEQRQQAGSMPGRGRRAARDVLAGTGADMSRFPAPAHLACRAGRTPAGPPVRQARRPRPAQARQPVHRRRHRPDLRPGRRTQTREGARCRRILRRAGPSKGQGSPPAAPRCASATCCCPAPGMRYHDPGPDYHDQQRNIARQVSHHAGKLSSLGCEVTLCRLPQPDGPGEDTQGA